MFVAPGGSSGAGRDVTAAPGVLVPGDDGGPFMADDAGQESDSASCDTGSDR